MLLITNKTTLGEFVGAKSLCIKDPTTNLLCQLTLRNTMSGRAKFMFTVQSHVKSRPCKYLRFKSGCKNIIVAKAEELLTTIKEGNFIFDY